jgi:hypothetical protein
VGVISLVGDCTKNYKSLYSYYPISLNITKLRYFSLVEDRLGENNEPY